LDGIGLGLYPVTPHATPVATTTAALIASAAP
jgi:hypothetical protein